MATWELSAARDSLRTLLADNDGDKFEFKVPTYPVPNGVTTHFSVGRTKLVEGSLALYLNDVQVDEGNIDEVDTDLGTVDLVSGAPSGAVLLASFGFKWWSDDMLEEAVQQGFFMLNFETIASVTPVALRGVTLDFAAYHAYMMMASLYAEDQSVSAGGYTADYSRTHPNWRELARLAFEKAQTKLKLYLETSLGQESPEMAFTAYRLVPWQVP
jgi:hypothetical protein